MVLFLHPLKQAVFTGKVPILDQYWAHKDQRAPRARRYASYGPVLSYSGEHNHCTAVPYPQ